MGIEYFQGKQCVVGRMAMMSYSDTKERQVQLVKRAFSRSKEYAAEYQGNTPIAHFFNTRIRRVVQLLKGFEEGRVLDVGCGPAVIGQVFRNKPIQYYGIDVSDDMTHFCMKAYAEESQFHFTIGKIEKLEFPEDSFDVVLCLGVLEYVLDGLAAMREVVRVLKPNGIAIATMLNDRSPYRFWQNHVYWKLANGIARIRCILQGAPGKHGANGAEERHRPETVGYDESAFRRLLTTAGLVVEDVAYYDFNIVPSPLYEVIPAVSIFVSSHLESLCRSWLRFLGTGFMMKCRKKRSTPLGNGQRLQE